MNKIECYDKCKKLVHSDSFILGSSCDKWLEENARHYVYIKRDGKLIKNNPGGIKCS
jgi:hypothetical protein